MELHPQILQKNGKNEFAILPYEEFEALRELAEDYEDVRDLREAKAQERDAPTFYKVEISAGAPQLLTSTKAKGLSNQVIQLRLRT